MSRCEDLMNEIKDLKTRIYVLEHNNDKLKKIDEDHQKLNGKLREEIVQLEKDLDNTTSELDEYVKRKMEAIQILNNIPMNSSNCVYKMKIDKAILALIGADEE